MNEQIDRLRMKQLEDNMLQDLEMLKAFEDEIRYESDPGKRIQYNKRIDHFRISFNKNQQELNTLETRIKMLCNHPQDEQFESSLGNEIMKPYIIDKRISSDRTDEKLGQYDKTAANTIKQVGNMSDRTLMKIEINNGNEKLSHEEIVNSLKNINNINEVNISNKSSLSQSSPHWQACAEVFADVKENEKSISFINEFFNTHIIKKLYKWDICIKIPRRGEFIYDEHKRRCKDLNRLYDINSDSIDKETIEFKSILIFDDAIVSGELIRKVLDLALTKRPKKVSVACLFAVDKTILELKELYPSTEFLCASVISKEEFYNNYHKLIFPYLDYISLPIQKNRPILQIKFTNIIDKHYIFDFFIKYGEIIKEESRIAREYPDRDKKSLILNQHFLRNIEFFCIMEDLEVLNLQKMIIDLRIYLRNDEYTMLIIEPIIREAYVEKYSLDIDRLDYYGKSNLLQYFLREVLNNITSIESINLNL